MNRAIEGVIMKTLATTIAAVAAIAVFAAAVQYETDARSNQAMRAAMSDSP